MEDFLKETEYCDFSHPKIKFVAEKITANLTSDKEKAVAIFYWVRDEIYYRVGFWNQKASKTLEEEKGTCTNSANLFIALCRSVGIPAGYYVLKVNGQQYFGPIVPKLIKKTISKESVHIHAGVFLNNKWIKCDPSDDYEISQKTSHLNPQSKLIDWDGEKNAVLNLEHEHIIKEEGPLTDIDRIISKKPKTAKGIIIKIGNLYIDFLRESGHNIKSVDELETQFREWIKKRQIFYYYIYLFASVLTAIRIKISNR